MAGIEKEFDAPRAPYWGASIVGYLPQEPVLEFETVHWNESTKPFAIMGLL